MTRILDTRRAPTRTRRCRQTCLHALSFDVVGRSEQQPPPHMTSKVVKQCHRNRLPQPVFPAKFPLERRIAQGPELSSVGDQGVTAVTKMVRCTAPRAGKQFRGQADPGHVTLNERQNIQHPLTRLHRMRPKPPLPERSPTTVALIEPSHVPAAHILHHTSQCVFATGQKKQVHMIRQQDIAECGHPSIPNCIAQNIEVSLPVLIVSEDGAVVVSTLNHVMNQARKHQACLPRHADRPRSLLSASR